MYSYNSLIKLTQIESSLKEDTDFSIRDEYLKKIVTTAATTPLEFSCAIAQAFAELDAEFNAKKKALQSVIGRVVTELVKQEFDKKV